MPRISGSAIVSNLNVTRYDASQPRGALLVLAHGAGAGQRHPFMTAVARGLAERGVDVVTFDFAYMAAKRKVPDKAPVLEETFRAVIAAARAGLKAGPYTPPDVGADLQVGPDRKLFIGGKSMGGRMATHLGAQGLEGLRGIVALGYPLHPPGRPDQPRTAHLPAIEVPVLIVQGERDTFGTPPELEPVIATMRAPVTLHVVAGGDHSLGVRGRAPDQTRAPVLDAIAGWIYSV
jgi:predicted alpha/beta-hydrolase family hydrolase